MPSGSRLALIVLLSLLAVGVVLPAAVGSASGAPADAHADVSSLEAGQSAAATAEQIDGRRYQTDTRIAIQLAPDGDARFSVTYRANLTGDVNRTAFEETATEFENGGVTDLGLSSFRRGRAEASKTVDRAMEVRDVERTASVTSGAGENATGRLTLSFTWTNFARNEDGNGRLEVGDAFQTPAGTWLPRLEPGQEFVISPPEGYGPVTGSGDLREGSFYWEGPRTFTADTVPSAVFSGDSLPVTALLALAFGGVISVLGLGYLVVRRQHALGDGGDDAGAAAAVAGTAESDDGGEHARGEAGADGDAGGAAAGAGGAAAGDGATAAGDGAAADDEVDVELLSDEERVERLLNQNGGRMKQASIVKETGWSNAKVSQLLSSMEEDDRIDKLRIGRENLISFPDEDVADVEE